MKASFGAPKVPLKADFYALKAIFQALNLVEIHIILLFLRLERNIKGSLKNLKFSIFYCFQFQFYENIAIRKVDYQKPLENMKIDRQ